MGTHFGVKCGPILEMGTILDPFWSEIWTHFGVKCGPSPSVQISQIQGGHWGFDKYQPQKITKYQPNIGLKISPCIGWTILCTATKYRRA